MPAISVSVKPEIYMGLEKATQSTGFTKSRIVDLALEMYLRELQEDAEDAKEAEQAWKEFVASGKKGFTLEEVKAELGL